MAPPKATTWPSSILMDPDVLSVDVLGRFVLCRVCAESYARYGGKQPRPVRLNARFRPAAWETHKLRTRAHRLTPSEELDSTDRVLAYVSSARSAFRRSSRLDRRRSETEYEPQFYGRAQHGELLPFFKPRYHFYSRETHNVDVAPTQVPY